MLILFEDGVAEELEAERIDGATYRLLSTPLATSSSVRRGDLVVLRDEGKVWRLERVEVPAAHVTLELVMSEDVIKSPALRTLFERIEAVGGEWERAYGGVVLLHVPSSHATEIAALLRELGQGNRQDD